MAEKSADLSAEPQAVEVEHNIEDFSDLHEELRILLQGSQVLTAFLILLPFNQGFDKINQSEKWVYLATFVCSVISLILLSAPAAQHRLQRPLHDRVAFKIFATRMVIAGLVPFSLSLSLASFLVTSEVVGFQIGAIISGVITLLILLSWWLKVISWLLTPAK